MPQAPPGFAASHLHGDSLRNTLFFRSICPIRRPNCCQTTLCAQPLRTLNLQSAGAEEKRVRALHSTSTRIVYCSARGARAEPRYGLECCARNRGLRSHYQARQGSLSGHCSPAMGTPLALAALWWRQAAAGSGSK